MYTTIGDGSEEHPYIIENLYISGGDIQIDIQNTNAHFIIRNCTLDWGDDAIVCNNVSNGQFLNNLITNAWYGIELSDTNHTVIKYNNISLCDVAIYFEEGAWYHTVVHNILDNNGIGIETAYTYYLTVKNNTCSYITGNEAFYIWGVNHSTFTNNRAIKCDSAEGFYIDDSCWNNTFTANLVSNCSTGFYMVDDGKYNFFIDNVIQFITDYGWELGASGEESSYNTFINNSADFCGSAGFYTELVPHSVFINNTARFNGDHGFHTSSVGDNLTFIGNCAENNTADGFHLEASNTIFMRNQANNNSNDGIQLEASNSNTLAFNRANNNTNHGISLYNADNCNISFNTANNNKVDGIYLSNSDNTNVTWNVVHNNFDCIIESGSSDNLIANNSCTAATLTSGAFTPASGDKDTLFNFTIIYTDSDNMTPFSVRVFVDGVAYDMDKLDATDNNFTDGCVYTVVTKLPKGDSQIYFEAYEITNQVVTTEVAGPTVKGGIPWMSLYLLLPAIGLAAVLFKGYKRRLE
jgi:parallel beta-helix repeat protein